MRKKNTLLALAVIAAVPGLMLLQQFLMPRKKSAAVVRPLPLVTHQIYAATENALIYGDKRAAVVAWAAGLYLRSGDQSRAEKWCRLGAYEYRHPSIMVFYGDFLAGRKRFKEARRWYSLALHQAGEKGKKKFIDLVEKKLKAVSAEGKK